MNRPNSPIREEELLGRLKAGNQLAFSELYDRYAPALLGVITKIISNEPEAIELLEKTFIEVRSQADQFQMAKQPLFAWLFGVARRVALDALKNRTSPQTPPLQLTTSGQISTLISPTNQINGPANTPNTPRLNELLDAIVFKNCTPEEAAASLNIPLGLARQQLRTAMQQVRVS